MVAHFFHSLKFALLGMSIGMGAIANASDNKNLRLGNVESIVCGEIDPFLIGDACVALVLDSQKNQYSAVIEYTDQSEASFLNRRFSQGDYVVIAKSDLSKKIKNRKQKAAILLNFAGRKDFPLSVFELHPKIQNTPWALLRQFYDTGSLLESNDVDVTSCSRFPHSIPTQAELRWIALMFRSLPNAEFVDVEGFLQMDGRIVTFQIGGMEFILVSYYPGDNEYGVMFVREDGPDELSAVATIRDSEIYKAE